MKTTTRPISEPVQKEPRKLYVFKLTSFKKNDRNLRMVVSASSKSQAWSEARRRSYGFAYYLEEPQIFLNKKAAQPLDCPQT